MKVFISHSSVDKKFVRTLKDCLNENGIETVDILKLDIESAEKELFNFNTENWLPRIETIVIELHDWMKPGCSNSFFRAISTLPISTTIYGGMLVVKNIELK